MNMQQLVARNHAGSISTHKFVVNCLALLDPADPSAVLRQVPEDTRPCLREFVGTYKQGEMLSTHSGPIPTAAQIDAARKWLADLDAPSHPIPNGAPGRPAEAASTSRP